MCFVKSATSFFSVVHRGQTDVNQHRGSGVHRPSKRPKTIIIEFKVFNIKNAVVLFLLFFSFCYKSVSVALNFGPVCQICC